MATHTDLVALLSSDRYYPVILTERMPVNPCMPDRIATLKVRNVSDKRGDEGQHAHIEIEIDSLHKTRTAQASASVTLTKEAAMALINELLRGFEPSEIAFSIPATVTASA